MYAINYTWLLDKINYQITDLTFLHSFFRVKQTARGVFMLPCFFLI